MREILLVAVLLPLVKLLEFPHNSFYKINQRNVQMITQRNDTAFSEVRCGIKCVQSSVDCYSFTFNWKTNACSLGTWLLPSLNYLAAQVSAFTIGAFCNTDDNYVLLQNGSESSCLRVSKDNRNYTMARSECQASGGHLYTMKNADKYYMAAPYLKSFNQYIWIGLDDIEQENVFKWVDDGTLLTNELRQLIFSPGEPNNYNNNEDCAAIYPSTERCNDYVCSYSIRYVCEMFPFKK